MAAEDGDPDGRCCNVVSVWHESGGGRMASLQCRNPEFGLWLPLLAMALASQFAIAAAIIWRRWRLRRGYPTLLPKLEQSTLQGTATTAESMAAPELAAVLLAELRSAPQNEAVIHRATLSCKLLRCAMLCHAGSAELRSAATQSYAELRCAT